MAINLTLLHSFCDTESKLRNIKSSEFFFVDIRAPKELPCLLYRFFKWKLFQVCCLFLLLPPSHKCQKLVNFTVFSFCNRLHCDDNIFLMFIYFAIISSETYCYNKLFTALSLSIYLNENKSFKDTMNT